MSEKGKTIRSWLAHLNAAYWTSSAVKPKDIGTVSMGMDLLRSSGPILALKFVGNTLLSGEGPELVAHDVTTGSVLSRTKVFSRNKIHGISHENGVVALWGGRSLAFVRFSDLNGPNMQLGVNDWVVHVNFSSDGATAYVLTAHNVVLVVDVASHRITAQKSCGEKSILYSGYVAAIGNKVTVVAGTVMSGIVVWDLDSETVTRNLTGHEGSIFGVKLNADGSRLVSCSDDRSIKLWDLATGENVATGWGHGARIWSLQFFGDRVLSTSEECTARVWEQNGSELVATKVFNAHQGKNCWCGDVSEALGVIATGGSDGRIRLFDISEETRPNALSKSWLPETVAEITKVELAKGEIFKEYATVAKGTFCVTSEGNLFFLTATSQWQFLLQDCKFAGFSLVRSLGDIAVVSSKAGEHLLLKLSQTGEIMGKQEFCTEGLKGKVTNTMVVAGEKKLLVVDSPVPTDPFVVHTVTDSLEIESTLSLVKPDMRFTTTSLAYDEQNNHLLLSSRYTTLALYDLASGALLSSWKKFVPGDTITSVGVVHSAPGKTVFSVVVRDGFYHFLEVSTGEVVTSRVLGGNRVQKAFLEGLFEDSNGDIILYGFRSAEFFVWNETQQYEVFTETCGGLHRQWLFDEANFTFTYTRASAIHVRSVGQFPFSRALNFGNNGREIRSMAAQPKERADSTRLVLIGSEDTCIRLSILNKAGELHNVWSERKHVSGIQQVRFIDTDLAISSAAREELYVWRIDDSYKRPYISVLATLEPISANPDLRIMDFDTYPVFSNGEKAGFLVSTVYSDSAIRVWYLDLFTEKFTMLVDDKYTTCCLLDSVFILRENRLHLMTGATDGHISIWDITSSLPVSIEANVVSLVSLPAKAVSLPACLVNQQVHQSGIKSLDVRVTTEAVHVVTGGDDNAIALLRLFGHKTLEVVSFVADAAASTVTSVEFITEKQEILVTSVDQIVRVWSFDEPELKLINSQYVTVADTGCSLVTSVGAQAVALVGGAGISIYRL